MGAGIILSALSGAGNAAADSIAMQQKVADEQALMKQRAELEEQKQKSIDLFRNQLTNEPVINAGNYLKAAAGTQVPASAQQVTNPSAPIMYENAGNPTIDDIVRAITGVESGGNANAVSPQGAKGSMQIMPATFAQYAKPGESYDNDADRRAAATRKIQDDLNYYNGDVAKVAAAYIGGRGGIDANGNIRTDVKDALGTTPKAYAERVLSRLKTSGTGSKEFGSIDETYDDIIKKANNLPDSDPNKQKLLDSIYAQMAADQNTVNSGSSGQMRDATPQEVAMIAYKNALADGDFRAAAQLKAMIPEKTLKVGKDESIVDASDPSKVIFANTAGADKERMKIEADAKRQEVKGRQDAILNAMKLDPLGINAPPGGYMKALSGAEPNTTGQTQSEGTLAERIQGKTGADVLKELPPAISNRVKAILDGRESFPSTARNNPRNAQLLDLAAQVDPSFDAVNFNRRNQTAKAFASGKQGDTVKSINQTISHVGELYDAIDKLDNFNGIASPLNYVVNPAQKYLLGDSRQGIVQQDIQAVASELRKVFSGSGAGNLTELKEWQDSMPLNASKEAQKAYLVNGIHLLYGAMDAMQNQYEAGMGPTIAAKKPLITPKSQAILNKIMGTGYNTTTAQQDTNQGVKFLGFE